MKHILIASIIAITFSSCASLYNTPTAPTPFLEQKEGYAIQGGIGTNLATNFASASITKAISKDVCLNVNGSISFMGNYQSIANPYNSGAKKMNSLAINYGWNTRHLTTFPFQLWVGLQSGIGNDSYYVAPWEKIRTKDYVSDYDTAGNVTQSFESATGNFVAGRIGLSHVLLSNYENEMAKKARKKTKFDVIGTLNYTPIKYNYTNTINNLIENNALLGYNTAIRVYQDKWILTLNLDNNATAKKLRDDLINVKNPRPLFGAIPMCIPTLSYTMFFGRPKTSKY